MAYISATDVKAIREELKSTFPKWKFAVRKGSGSLSVDVTILQGTCAFEGKTSAQVNEYWIDSQWKNAEDKMALEKISEIMHNAPGRAGGKVFFDHSDVQTDYFNTAFYTHLSIGDWCRPYARAVA
jgi:hypothetical protein